MGSYLDLYYFLRLFHVWRNVGQNAELDAMLVCLGKKAQVVLGCITLDIHLTSSGKYFPSLFFVPVKTFMFWYLSHLTFFWISLLFIWCLYGFEIALRTYYTVPNIWLYYRFIAAHLSVLLGAIEGEVEVLATSSKHLQCCCHPGYNKVNQIYFNDY